MYKSWKRGVFHDTVLVEYIIDDNIEKQYVPLSLYVVSEIRNKAGEIISVIFSSSNRIIELSKSDIERYDNALNYEQQIPNDAE